VTAAALVDAARNGLELAPSADQGSWTLVRKEPRLVLEISPEAVGHPLLDELASLLNLEPGLVR
jgi:hypothetical protein